MKACILENMIHPEVAEILPKVEIAVVPVGSCEQHGPNTTYYTDTARAYSFCKLLGEHYGEKLLICPPVTYGVSIHHMGFAGVEAFAGVDGNGGFFRAFRQDVEFADHRIALQDLQVAVHDDPLHSGEGQTGPAEERGLPSRGGRPKVHPTTAPHLPPAGHLPELVCLYEETVTPGRPALCGPPQLSSPHRQGRI